MRIAHPVLEQRRDVARRFGWGVSRGSRLESGVLMKFYVRLDRVRGLHSQKHECGWWREGSKRSGMYQGI